MRIDIQLELSPLSQGLVLDHQERANSDPSFLPFIVNSMRFRTLEIRWHDSKPISTCDFQPVSFKKARPAVGQERNYPSQAYRLATGGDDNHVRVGSPLERGPVASFTDTINV